MTSHTTSTRVPYDAGDPDGAVLVGLNLSRTNLIVSNKSGVDLLLHFSPEPATEDRFTLVLGPGDVLDLSTMHPDMLYTGVVTYRWAAATAGYAMVSEWHRSNV